MVAPNKIFSFLDLGAYECGLVLEKAKDIQMRSSGISGQALNPMTGVLPRERQEIQH